MGNRVYERKSCPFELEEKGIDMEERTFKGYFAISGHFDGKDVIDYGAFKRTLKEQGHRVKIFWIHDFNNPIGKPIEIKEVPRNKLPQAVLDRAPDATGGLYVYGRIDPIPEGDRALIQMKSGTLDEGSIGFDRVKEEWEENENGVQIPHIKELKLYDISPVPIAMQEAAIITDVKMVDIEGQEVKIEESDDFIHVPISSEEGKHDGHRIRYIDIDADKGIRAKYCGECKVIISYVFAKENDWTVAKAVAWVKEHAKAEEAEKAKEEEQTEAINKAKLTALKQWAEINR